MATTQTTSNHDLDNTIAEEAPAIGGALVNAIIPLERYIFGGFGLNKPSVLWSKFTILELKQHLKGLTEKMQDFI